MGAMQTLDYRWLSNARAPRAKCTIAMSSAHSENPLAPGTLELNVANNCLNKLKYSHLKSMISFDCKTPGGWKV